MRGGQWLFIAIFCGILHFQYKSLLSSRMISSCPDIQKEAEHLYKINGGPGCLPKCLDVIRHQFTVIQGRTQLLLTLATITLTITGFSGPKIAQTNFLARYSMAAGIAFVLLALVMVLLGSMRVRWVTQFIGQDDIDTLVAILKHRNLKVLLFECELTLLIIGLSLYVISVITYLLHGIP